MISIVMTIIVSMFFQYSWSTDKFREVREEMVRTQLISRGISGEKILSAFRTVPRHCFVPEELVNSAYGDFPLPIGEGQTISQPYVVAFMTEVLRLKPGDKVLEIGTGSGYQAAILAEMEADVYSIELIEPLARSAEKTLTSLGYEHIRLKTGDGYLGWPEFAPFDAILVTCSPSEIPLPLKQQLADGGKMIIPVGKQHHVQYLYLLEKRNGKIRQENVMPVRFVPMVNEKGKTY